jgi:hypothetical protein
MKKSWKHLSELCKRVRLIDLIVYPSSRRVIEKKGEFVDSVDINAFTGVGDRKFKISEQP